ncbi:hypothetical protein P3T73_10850 [Kiritimatiellota bacterium B12222]|nr:hypothetical protein P3T73_10850 [Kiritimatiellota bacterium B12222]
MIAFCHTYKTAGTSFNTILRKHFKWRHFDSPGFQHQALSPQNLKNLKWIYPHLQSIIGHTIHPDTDLQIVEPDIQYYTFLRDPVARSISHITWFLRWKAHAGVFVDDFETLVKKWAKAPENRNRQCRQLCQKGTAEGVQQVVRNSPFLFLRVEFFDLSLLLFRHWVGEPGMNLSYQRKNTLRDQHDRLQSRHPEYLKKIRLFQKHLRADPDLQSILKEANREDQALYDWVASDIWPQQLQAYPGDLVAETQEFQQSLKENSSTLPEPLLSRMHRNFVLKPIRPLLLPNREPLSAKQSPWL